MDRDKKLTAIGSYNLTGKILGKGNFATVYEGVHTILGTKVAVKAIGKARLQQQYVLKNLKREAQILFRLNHPCVLRLYETIQHEDFYYLITELVPGRDFNAYLSMQPNGQLSENQSRRFAAQLFSAVNHLHKHFVVHRDLKLENILIDKRKDWIKLIDFGLSNTWNKHTLLTTNCGSPEYAAPELFIEGKGYGPEVDLWSLGVVLYIMASGKLPFRVKISQHQEPFPNNHRVALYHQITRGLTTRHYNNIKHYSGGFLQLLEKLLVPNSEKRITMCAAIKHPWITAIKKNIVRSSWKIGLYKHQKILEEISNITNISIMEVTTVLKYEPYGKLGGLYNILAHNKMLNEHHVASPYKNSSCKCKHFDNGSDDSGVYSFVCRI